MKPCNTPKISTKSCLQSLAAGLFFIAAHAQAHVSLEPNMAQANSNYRAALRVSHGCQGSPTRMVELHIPLALQGAKPMPKPGWKLEVLREPLAKPYTSHGQEVLHDTRTIRWTATAPEHHLADGHYDEFVFRARVAQPDGPVWVKVRQVCEQGEWNWSETPSSGVSTKGLKAPAALLEIVPAGQSRAAHVH